MRKSLAPMLMLTGGLLSGCVGGAGVGGQPTISDVRQQIEVACGFVTNNQDILRVARTLGGAASPAVGLSFDIAQSTVTKICDVWNVAKAAKKEAVSTAIVVNGIVVHGRALK